MNKRLIGEVKSYTLNILGGVFNRIYNRGEFSKYKLYYPL